MNTDNDDADDDDDDDNDDEDDDDGGDDDDDDDEEDDDDDEFVVGFWDIFWAIPTGMKGHLYNARAQISAVPFCLICCQQDHPLPWFGM